MTDEQANATMMRNVSVPTFFQKVASAVGHSPSDNAAADQLLRTNDMIKMAVDRYIQACVDSDRQHTESSVKVATDAAFALAGVAPAQEQAHPGVDAAAFLADDSVKAAAQSMVDSYVKAAMAAAVPPATEPSMPGLNESEDDEEEKKRKAAEAADAAAPPG